MASSSRAAAKSAPTADTSVQQLNKLMQAIMDEHGDQGRDIIMRSALGIILPGQIDDTMLSLLFSPSTVALSAPQNTPPITAGQPPVHTSEPVTASSPLPAPTSQPIDTAGQPPVAVSTPSRRRVSGKGSGDWSAKSRAEACVDMIFQRTPIKRPKWEDDAEEESPSAHKRQDRGGAPTG